jgi:hypothetical protein
VEDVIKKYSRFTRELGIIIIHSTMPVGETRKLKEKHRLRHLYVNLLFFRDRAIETDMTSPHRIVLGVVPEQPLDPEVELFIGTWSVSAYGAVQTYFMPYEHAELVKLATNALRATITTYFNGVNEYLEEYGKGQPGNSLGVYGQSDSNVGVYGTSNAGYGLLGLSSGAYGVYAYSNTSYGLYARGESGLAALLEGNVTISGTLQKAGGSFKIDHPLDPANKYLSHSFVESPDMKNVYDGMVTLDDKGEAVIELPDWFGALNKDFRYQLTAIGAPGPNLYIADEISDDAATTSNYNDNKSRFKVAGGASGIKVSWQVTGIRKDPWANAHRISVEEDKPAKERGYYTYPELFMVSSQKRGR